MSICQRCHTEFTCAMADNTGQECWCTALPPVDFSCFPDGKIPANASCLCPSCLPQWKAEIAAGKNKLE